LSFGWVGNDYVGPVPCILLVAAVVIAGCGFLLRCTVFG
ncbi:MAG: hypothetical protein JWM35_2037, partial [Verrucomicrobia bacterium]|nr:hypothetical protein [Verrucomicrobiota bacterium]